MQFFQRPGRVERFQLDEHLKRTATVTIFRSRTTASIPPIAFNTDSAIEVMDMDRRLSRRQPADGVHSHVALKLDLRGVGRT